jgi:hypothetical protein
MFRLSLLFLFFLDTVGAFSQKQITTFGLQVKPIISSQMFNTGAQVNQEGDVTFTLEPKSGFGFGMVVRKGFNEQFSLETGINYTQRNYQITVEEDSTSFKGESDFTYVIYEIPIMGLVYIQLGEDTYMNTAFGLNLNFLPSDWESFDDNIFHYSERTSWIIPALQANIGFEYRTYESGFWYLGFSYHQPFTNLTEAGVGFGEIQSPKEITFFDVSGTYLTIDLKYFFHEPASRR